MKKQPLNFLAAGAMSLVCLLMLAQALHAEPVEMRTFDSPLPPPIITLTAESGWVNIELNWTPPGNPWVTQYRVQRSLGEGGPYSPIAVTPQLVYFDSNGLTAGQNYCYYVEALYGDGSVAGASNVACAVYGRAVLWVPYRVYGYPGQIVPIPINIRNAQGLGIAATDIWFEFLPIIEPISITHTSLTAAYSWSYSFSSTPQGTTRVRIAAITNPQNPPVLYGDGSLFWLYVQVHGSVGMTTPLDLRDFIVGVGGSQIYVPEDLYHSIPLVLEDGMFEIGESYILGDLNGNGVVEAVDAYIALLIASGQLVPTWQQLMAGDVNGNGVVDAGDASMILFYASHGYWPTPPGGGVQGLASVDPVTISLPRAKGAPGSVVETELRGENLSDWAGADIVVTYDPAVVAQVVSVEPVGLGAGFELSYKVDGGALHIHMASGAPVSGSGSLLRIRWRLPIVSVGRPVTPLTLAQTRLNDVAGRDFATSALQREIVRRNGSLEITCRLPRR